jgi:drug/metabolite transporter (DMT)-like permease
VILERTQTSGQLQLKSGITFATITALAQAVGAVLSRAALVNASIDPLWSTLVRLLGGLVVSGLWLIVDRNQIRVGLPMITSWGQSFRLLGWVAGTAFFSTCLGIWLQQISLKYAATGIAQALSSTSPLFVLPIAVMMNDRVSYRAVLGAIVALIGVWLLFLR